MRQRQSQAVVGTWAAAGLRWGFLLGTGVVAAACVVAVTIGIIGSAVSGTLDSSMRSAAGVGFVTMVALLVAMVIGPLVGLIVGLADGLALWALSRTASFRSATSPVRRRRAMGAVVLTTMIVGPAVPGLLLGWFGALAFSLPTIAGAVVAARLSGALPPAGTRVRAAKAGL